MPGGPVGGDPIEIARPKLLIGEGRDEERFLTCLVKHLGLGDVQVIQYGGKTKLRSYLRALALQSEFRTGQVAALGVTRDVDESEPADVLKGIQAALLGANLPAPGVVEVMEATSPRVGVFLMPGGGRQGALEDICLEAVVSDPLMPCLDGYFDCLTQLGHPHPLPHRRGKARIHAWLATKEKPDLGLSYAAEAGYWPWDNPAFDALKRFISAL